jgi:hypothetical protein
VLRYWRSSKPSPTTWLPIVAIFCFALLARVGLWSLIVTVPLAATAMYVLNW